MLYAFKNDNTCFVNKGFTLIELLISLAIIGFLSSAVIALTINFGQNQTQNTVVQDIRSALYSARSQAQSVVSQQCGTTQFNGVQVSFCSATDSHGTDCSSSCVASPAPDYETDISCGPTPTLFVAQTKTTAPNITVTPPNCTLLFKPLGAGVTGGGSISVSGVGTTKTVIVNANGVIQ